MTLLFLLPAKKRRVIDDRAAICIERSMPRIKLPKVRDTIRFFLE